MKRSTRSYLGIYTIGVAALFLAGFLLLVVFGARTYRGVVSTQADNNADRALLSYFATCISGSDQAGGIKITDSEYGQVLEIPDGDSGYGLRIYSCDGRLFEVYGSLAMSLDPQQDISIGDTEEFHAEFVEDGILQITTDAGKTLIRLRSEGSGADS